MTSRSSSPTRLWPLLALNFFMADMQSGIGPFVGVFLQERGWASGMIGAAMTIGNVAGMLITTPIGGLIDASRNKRMWVVIPGICVVLASVVILISQDFWAVTASQIAQSLASAAIVPAVTGITLGIVRQKGFNRQNGRNQAFNHAGNMVGAARSGYLGYRYGYVAVFVLAAAFGAIAIACVLMIPAKAIDDRAARGSKEDDSTSPPDTPTLLLKHKPLLVLALTLAIFHLGNAAIVPLYGLAALAEGQANGPSFVATTVVVAQGVMVATSLVAMHVANKRNYWPVILVSFMFLPHPRRARLLPDGMVERRARATARRHRDRTTDGRRARRGRSLNGTGRINLGQGAVITVQGVGASLSPALGGWIAQWIGYGPTFLLLGGFGLASMALWFAFGAAVKQY